jgi:hypothetical protein
MNLAIGFLRQIARFFNEVFRWGLICWVTGSANPAGRISRAVVSVVSASFAESPDGSG